MISRIHIKLINCEHIFFVCLLGTRFWFLNSWNLRGKQYTLWNFGVSQPSAYKSWTLGKIYPGGDFSRLRFVAWLAPDTQMESHVLFSTEYITIGSERYCSIHSKNLRRCIQDQRWPIWMQLMHMNQEFFSLASNWPDCSYLHSCKLWTH